jgi:DNA-binding LacI/PurR family transcriptional regulator
MARHRSSPAVDAACERVRAVALQALAEGRHFLPSLGELSRRCGFSRATVHRAVRRLCSQGLLSAERHRGIHINKEAPEPVDVAPAAPLVPPRPRWQQVADGLVEGVISGRYGAEVAFPSAKQLCAELQATHATVAAALRCLVRRGRLVAVGRSHRVVRQAAPADAKVLLIAAESSMEWLSRATPRAFEVWRTLEQECHHRRLTLSVAAAAEVLRRPSLLRRSGQVGFLMLPLTIPRSRLHQLSLLLRDSQRPVAVLDEQGAQLPGGLTDARRCLTVRMATSSRSAEQVGRFLSDLGHRHLAYICLAPGDSITRLRYEGLAAVLAGAGSVALAHPEPAVDVEATLNATPLYRRYREAVRRGSEALAARLGGRRTEVGVDDFTWPVARRALVSRSLAPVLANLLKGPCTAWVCYNDELALLTLDYLAERRVSVPGRVSVVGFDDTLEAFGRALTSYNFNAPAAVRAMLDHVLGAGTVAGRDRHGAIEAPGMVMARQSSGRRQ